MMQTLEQHGTPGSVSEDEDSQRAEKLWKPYRYECSYHRECQDQSEYRCQGEKGPWYHLDVLVWLSRGAQIFGQMRFWSLI